MRVGPRLTSLAAGGLAAAASLCLPATTAGAASVRISDLRDVSFGTLNPTVDARNNQDVCIFSDTFFNGYRITARGSGASSAFTLSAGGSLPPLAYEVQWNDAPGRQTGTTLSPGVALGGLRTNGSDQTCALSLFENASLIILLRSSALSGAAANVQYSGTLTLTVSPE